MDVELLVTGDELVRGAIVDTNTPWFLERLGRLGLRARRVVAVGDRVDDLEAALREAAGRSDVVLVSGGLGPTSDDLTAECAARVAGVGLVMDAPSLERIRARYAARGRAVTPMAEKMARIPSNAEALPNDEGTAPGFRYRLAKADVFFVPGVPREFKHLCERSVLPAIEARTGGAMVTKTLKFLGVPESELDALFLPFCEARGIRLGLRATFPETWVTLSVAGKDADDARRNAATYLAEAMPLAGGRCFSVDGRSLPEVVGALALARKATLAVAESCTGGLLGGALTSVSGSSAWIVGGGITYANEEKIRQLGVAPELIARVGAVSAEVAEAMALGIRERTGATLGVSITGIAGPTGGTPTKPVGTVWIAVAGPRGVEARLQPFGGGDREMVRQWAVGQALERLRRALQALPGGPDA